ncbi:MAG: hypothetical protein EOO46_10265 [Flavobacterium sp.]|nr:MAG: hypothetical protein EOO46_10265 [Flavobacterium sp.]
MRGKILDIFNEESSACYLTSIDLGEYIKALPENYRDYEVQREIVSNAYLDNLIVTILEGRHIPPIVLVVSDNEFELDRQFISIKHFKILDGLQRTFRLKIIYDTIQLVEKELENDQEVFSITRITVAKRYKDALDEINSSSSLFFKIVEYLKTNRREADHTISSLFKRTQWFEIWANLSPDQEVNKMLVLNAGHKPVKTKHQLELLFRNILPVLQTLQFPDLKVIREKELSSTLYSKERSIGQFHFSHLITSLLSFVEGKPLTTNVNLIQKAQTDSFDDVEIPL